MSVTIGNATLLDEDPARRLNTGGNRRRILKQGMDPGDFPRSRRQRRLYDFHTTGRVDDNCVWANRFTGKSDG